MVMWYWIPITLFIGMVLGVFLIALVSANNK